MPFLRALKTTGADVSVIGKYPDDPCHAFVEHSIYQDYSDPKLLIEECKKHKFEYIVPSCNDYAYVAGSAVADALKLPGFDNPEVTAILHTKDRFRRFCLEIAISAPKILGEVSFESDLADIVDGWDGRALIKPVDSFSGRGIQLVHTATELADAVARAAQSSRSGRAVVEQFVDGALHSHSAFIADGRIVWHEFVDEYCEVYPYQVDRSRFPSRLTVEIRAAVNRSMEQIVNSLGLCDGLLHTQFIASETDFWIIECMRRCPGDLYGHHFRYSLDYDYEAQYVAGFLGRQPEAPAVRETPVPIERRVLSTATPSALFGIDIPPSASGMIYVPLKESGHKLAAAPFDKAGILFLKGAASHVEERSSAFPQMGLYELDM